MSTTQFTYIYFPVCLSIVQEFAKILKRNHFFFYSSCSLETPTRLKLHLAPDICNVTEKSYTVNNPVND